MARITARAVTASPPASSSRSPVSVGLTPVASPSEEAGAEDPGLLVGALGELGARDAARSRGSCGSASSKACPPRDSRSITSVRGPPRRRSRGGQPARPGADDRDVEVALVAGSC